MDAATSISAALGTVLGRGFRSDLYRELTRGVAPGLTDATYPVLSAVERSGEDVSAAVLAPIVGLDRSVVSRRAAVLMEHGLVAPVLDPADARQARFALTASGVRAIHETRRRLAGAIDAHLTGWTEQDREQFAALFSRFVATPLAGDRRYPPT